MARPVPIRKSPVRKSPNSRTIAAGTNTYIPIAIMMKPTIMPVLKPTFLSSILDGMAIMK